MASRFRPLVATLAFVFLLGGCSTPDSEPTTAQAASTAASPALSPPSQAALQAETEAMLDLALAAPVPTTFLSAGQDGFTGYNSKGQPCADPKGAQETVNAARFLGDCGSVKPFPDDPQADPQQGEGSSGGGFAQPIGSTVDSSRVEGHRRWVVMAAYIVRGGGEIAGPPERWWAVESGTYIDVYMPPSAAPTATPVGGAPAVYPVSFQVYWDTGDHGLPQHLCTFEAAMHEGGQIQRAIDISVFLNPSCTIASTLADSQRSYHYLVSSPHPIYVAAQQENISQVWMGSRIIYDHAVRELPTHPIG